jgi:HSP20 family protein
MNQLNQYDPFGDPGIDELFRGFFRPVRLDGRQSNGQNNVSIRMDVTEDDEAYVVHAEIPGVKKEDIHVAVEGNQVTLGAEVKQQVQPKDRERLLRSERSYGSAYRSFTLPMEVDQETSEARYENGVLELRLAKKPQIAGKRLEVR